jgi:hypothetical protein
MVDVFQTVAGLSYQLPTEIAMIEAKKISE